MSEGKHLEIERKYLIRMPDAAQLARQPGCVVWQIEQVYLTDGPEDQTRRVRKVTCDGETRCYRTFKRHVSALTSEEDEGEISPETYAALLAERDAQRMTIQKTRYRIPHGGHVVEIDVYPFWIDRAIMEIELESETEAFDIPDYIRVVRDVTIEKQYKNQQLAMRVPVEEIN